MTMSQTPTLHTVVLIVTDPDAALTYLTEKPGVEHDAQQDAAEFRGFQVAPGTPPCDLIPVSLEYPAGGTVGIRFKVDDLEGMRQDRLPQPAEDRGRAGSGRHAPQMPLGRQRALVLGPVASYSGKSTIRTIHCDTGSTCTRVYAR